MRNIVCLIVLCIGLSLCAGTGAGNFRSQLPVSSVSISEPVEMSVIPVKFKSWVQSPEGDLLTGTCNEVLRFTVLANDFVAILPKGSEGPFLELNDHDQIQITRQRFEKKYKEQYWLVHYIPGKTNTMLMATQFKNIESLKANFGEGVNVGLGPVLSDDYWSQIRAISVPNLMLYGDELVSLLQYRKLLIPESTDFIAKYEAMVLQMIQELGRQPKYVELANRLGVSIPRIAAMEEALKECHAETQKIILGDGTEFLPCTIVGEQLLKMVKLGIFKLHANTVFTITDEQPVSQTFLGVGGIRLMKATTKIVNLNSFKANYAKTGVILFYENESKTLVRVSMVHSPEQPNQKTTPAVTAKAKTNSK